VKHLLGAVVTVIAVLSAVGSALAADLPLRTDPGGVAKERSRDTRQHRALSSSSKHISRHASKARISLPGPDMLQHEPRISLPEPELLERQAAPDCQFKSGTSGDLALSTIMKLDYELQCYRQSESILRSRMERLQDARQDYRVAQQSQSDARGRTPGNSLSPRLRNSGRSTHNRGG
jgi:hypothetical protein